MDLCLWKSRSYYRQGEERSATPVERADWKWYTHFPISVFKADKPCDSDGPANGFFWGVVDRESFAIPTTLNNRKTTLSWWTLELRTIWSKRRWLVRLWVPKNPKP